jgi:hypothetical protein
MPQLGSPKASFVEQEWSFRILPAYRRTYPAGDFPEGLTVVPGQFFDGFGAPGLVAIDEAVVAEVDSGVRLFALAHETGHCVVYLECQNRNLQTPNTDTGANKKKHEMLADLIAMRVLGEKLPSTQSRVVASYGALAQKLGAGDAEHPSGADRVRVMKTYTDGADFDTLFQAIVAGVPV